MPQWSRWAKTLFKSGPRWLLGMLITALGAAYALGWYDNGTVARLDSLIAGERMKLQAPVLDPRIVIVDIDGKALTEFGRFPCCLLYTSPSPRDGLLSRMPSSA